jgi:hypothetical protein
MPSNFTKQPQYPLQPFLNSGTGDTTSQGTLTTVPSAVNASQGVQDLPGDRIVLGARDAFALSNTTVGNLYEGIYMRVANNATAAAAIGRLAFWDPAAFTLAASTSANNLDNLYQVTTAEPAAGSGPTGPVAGVFIVAQAVSTFWWIQIAGKATMAFGTATNSQFGGTNTYLLYGGVYASGMGTTNGSGYVTQIQGTTFITTNATLDKVINAYLGVAEVLPAASGLYAVDMKPLLYRL